MGICCDIQLVGSTVVYLSECQRKYCLIYVGCGQCIEQITTDWRGRSS